MASGAVDKGEPAEAETPLTDAYGARRVFWVDLGLSIALGGIIGALAFCFLSIVTHITDVWMGADERASALYRGFPSNLDGTDVSGFGTGPAWWLGITAGGGLIIGVVEWVSRYPRGGAPSFLQEIKHAHVDAWLGMRTAIAGLISLACGASVGPEYPLSAMGGSVASSVLSFLRIPDGRAQTLTLVGMCAAMGSIFASPVLAVLLMFELADFDKARSAEAAAMLFAGAVSSFAVYLGCETSGRTYLNPNLGPNVAAQYTIGWSLWYLLEAIPLGIVAGMLAAVMLLLRGVIEQAVTGLHKRVGASKLGAPSIILLPAVGGLLFGLVAMAAPLTIGDGSLPLFTIAGDGYSAYWARTGKALVAEFCGPTACAGNSTAARQALQVAKLQAQVALNKLQYEDALIPGWPNPSIDDRTYSASLIVGTLFLKMAAWAICQAFGFVGGIIFPFLFVGACAGNLAAQWTGINQSFATTALMFAVPSAITPLPFTFLAMGAFLLECSSYQTAAIFVAMLAAHGVTIGLGGLHRMTRAKTLGMWADTVPSLVEAIVYAPPASVPPATVTPADIEAVSLPSQKHDAAIVSA